MIIPIAPTCGLKLLEYNCPCQLPMTLRFRSMIRPVRLNGMLFWGLLLLLCTHLVAQVAGEKYSAQFMEADFTPGMTAPAHIHSGPEAWYAVGGETCLETSDGRMQISQTGVPPVIVPMGLSMHLTAIGTEERRSIVIILHQHPSPRPP